MVDPADVVRKLETGRAAFVRELRSLADDLERLSLPDAGEVLTWLVPHLERLRHEADRTFRRN
jgi:hypothetical protein